MQNLMNILFLSCLKATELVEKKLRFRLSPIEQMQLKMHRTMCKACSLYKDQSYLIEKGIERNMGGQLTGLEIQDLKEKIKMIIGRHNA